MVIEGKRWSSGSRPQRPVRAFFFFFFFSSSFSFFSSFCFLLHLLLPLLFFFFFFKFIYLFWERERACAHEWGRDTERWKERESQAGAQTHKPWGHDLSWNWTLNWLSHPGTPTMLFSNTRWRRKEHASGSIVLKVGPPTGVSVSWECVRSVHSHALPQTYWKTNSGGRANQSVFSQALQVVLMLPEVWAPLVLGIQSSLLVQVEFKNAYLMLYQIWSLVLVTIFNSFWNFR